MSSTRSTLVSLACELRDDPARREGQVSKSQRTKGAAFERECVILLNEHGADAERNLSQTRDGGYDIDSLFGAFECKKRAAIPAYLRPVENVRGVIFAQDRGERLVLLRFNDAAMLMRLAHEFSRGASIEEAGKIAMCPHASGQTTDGACAKCGATP